MDQMDCRYFFQLEPRSTVPTFEEKANNYQRAEGRRARISRNRNDRRRSCRTLGSELHALPLAEVGMLFKQSVREVWRLFALANIAWDSASEQAAYQGAQR
jgi:hypothetical protein